MTDKGAGCYISPTGEILPISFKERGNRTLKGFGLSAGGARFNFAEEFVEVLI